MSCLRCAGRDQAGLSLVELMIALALGIIIVAAMAELFVGISKSNQEMARTNSQIESARFAMQYLENDIVHAGYWGGFIPQWDDFAREDPLTYTSVSKQDPCLAYTDSDWNGGDATGTNYGDFENAAISMPVEVFSTIPTACASVGAIVSSELVANTDIVVIRHADTRDYVASDPNDALYIQASNCDAEIGSTPYVLSNDPNDFVLTERDCLSSNRTPRRRWIQNIYWVRNYAVSSGDGIPTLVRSSMGVSSGTPTQQAAVPLVEGIERFRAELGVDRRSHTGGAVANFVAIDWADEDLRTMPRNRGNGVADGLFERCLSNEVACSEDDLTNVVAVKLYILARATEASVGYIDEKTYVLGSSGTIGPFRDSFKRHVFSTTIRLNNVSGRRDTPYDPNGV